MTWRTRSREQFVIRYDSNYVGEEFRFGEGGEYAFPCSAATAYRSKLGATTPSTPSSSSSATTTSSTPTTSSPPASAASPPSPSPTAAPSSTTSSAAPPPPPPSPSTSSPRPLEHSRGVSSDDPARAGDGDGDVDYVAMIRALERPLKDREALLACRNRDFLAVLAAATRREEERHRAEALQRKDGLVARTRLAGAAGPPAASDAAAAAAAAAAGDDPVEPKPRMLLKAGKVGEGVPIILVPSASQTLITIYNVKEFLEDGRVTVQKKLSRDRAVAAYEVRDKPSALKPDDWDRVVAVFVLGKEWQFKDWPFKDHVEIFNKIIGFFVRFEDDSVESAKMVKQWNVKIISISKNKRHQDRAAALEVWDRLEAFMRSRSH
uniref:Cell division control protein 73 C-terminal domain-containing protein n=1 Tax=Ananas comosus var. bracteatus TaxID=296719 RepID=A0A6V7QFS8_ANACO|nr:unnamed protein product [Ananas comosus var. bracteatus]